MSVYDRDWYRDDYKKRAEKYGNDFSLNSNRRVSPTPPNGYQRSNETINIATVIICIVCCGLSTYCSLKVFTGNPVFPVISTIIGLVLFITAIVRRKHDKGIMNAFAMVISMISFVFSFVLSFFLIYVLRCLMYG